MGILNLERLVSNFIEGDSGITSVRSIEISKKYLWALDFYDPEPPAPFDKLFPVFDVDLQAANVQSFQFNQGQNAFKLPRRQDVQDMQITFYDDETNTLLKWFTDWINLDIANNGLYISGLEDSHTTEGNDSFGDRRRVYPTRKIRLSLFNSFRNTVTFYNYSVTIADSEIRYNGSQASEAQTYTVSLHIVDDINKETQSDSPANSFLQNATDIARNVLGRFI